MFSWLCFKVNFVQLAEVLQSWRFQFDSPISSILLFPLSCQKEPSGRRGLSKMIFFTSQNTTYPSYIKKADEILIPRQAQNTKRNNMWKKNIPTLVRVSEILRMWSPDFSF